MKIHVKSLLKGIGAFVLPVCVALSSCTAEPDESNRFTFTGETVNDFLLNNDSLFSDFNYILKRSGQDRILSSYGEYTCFAPKNAAIAEYIDSLWNDKESVDDYGNLLHNGMTDPSLEGLSDSLCTDIVMYHLVKATITTTEMITNASATYRTMLGRNITAGSSGSQILVNGGAPIDRTLCDNEVVNGIVHAIDKCIPRSNRLVADELRADSTHFSIFYEALIATGLHRELEVQQKQLSAAAPSPTADYYIPTECKKGFTVFAETDDVFHANGIYTFDDLVAKCKEWYRNAATPGPRTTSSGWYDYFRNNEIEVDLSDQYTKYNNVVHMFMAYHILKTSVNPHVLAYTENTYSGHGWKGEAYDYYETMLPKTLVKAWSVNMGGTNYKIYLNRYIRNNTLTDGAGSGGYESLGSDAMHEVVYEGAEVRTDSVLQPLNGYIYPIKDILLYDGKVPLGVLNERMRFDALTLLGETMDNGFRGAYISEITALNSGKSATRVRFPIDYFDNVVVFNGNNTQLDMNIPMDHVASGGNSYTLYKGDSFQGMGVFDFAIKLPPVPDGTYELRINNDCMTHGSMLQLYKGRGAKPVASSMTPLGVPLDMRIQMDNWNDPVVVAMGAVPLNDEENYPDAAADKGLESDKVMRTHGFMRGPLSICRQNRPEVITRYVSHQYRKIVDTDVYYQDDYWLRLKTVLDDGNLERKFQIDYIEFVPVGVAQNQQYLEDVY